MLAWLESPPPIITSGGVLLRLMVMLPLSWSPLMHSSGSFSEQARSPTGPKDLLDVEIGGVVERSRDSERELVEDVHAAVRSADYVGRARLENVAVWSAWPSSKLPE